MWGSDAKVYKPTRWLDFEKQPSFYKFNSFSAGPRICVGQQFAMTEAVIIIAMIFQKFEFELEEPSKIARYGVSASLPMLGGLKARVRRRTNVL
jgi:cytochrome P450